MKYFGFMIMRRSVDHNLFFKLSKHSLRVTNWISAPPLNKNWEFIQKKKKRVLSVPYQPKNARFLLCLTALPLWLWKSARGQLERARESEPFHRARAWVPLLSWITLQYNTKDYSKKRPLALRKQRIPLNWCLKWIAN